VNLRKDHYRSCVSSSLRAQTAKVVERKSLDDERERKCMLTQCWCLIGRKTVEYMSDRIAVHFLDK
jgi:hypothetical protein